jgi:hypothetical protein
VCVCVCCVLYSDRRRQRAREKRRVPGKKKKKKQPAAEKREEKSSRRGQHVATSTVDHQIQLTEQIAKAQSTNAPRETWHNFSLSTFPFPLRTRRASKRQQRENKPHKGEELYLTSTVSTTRPGNQPQRR